MGYIKFNKTNGDYDLLPAENIVHVLSGADDEAEIVYAIAAGADFDKLVNASIAISASEESTSGIRIAINDAIQLANGASGPAITVALENPITSVTPGVTA